MNYNWENSKSVWRLQQEEIESENFSDVLRFLFLIALLLLTGFAI